MADSNKSLVDKTFEYISDQNNTPNQKISYLVNLVETMNQDEQNKLLFMASSYNCFTLEMIKTIIEAGADPRHDNDQCFLVSCQRSDPTIASFFLEFGVDPNIQNGRALIYACDYNNVEVVKLLLESGAKVTDNIIDFAIDGRSIGSINLFLENDIDPDLIFKVLIEHLFGYVSPRIEPLVKKMISKVLDKDINYQAIFKEICKEK